LKLSAVKRAVAVKPHEGQNQKATDQAAQANGAERIEVFEHGLLRDISEPPQRGCGKKQEIGLRPLHDRSLSWGCYMEGLVRHPPLT